MRRWPAARELPPRLNPDQVAWLKEKGGPSETVRALITEAMALDNLARSVKARGAKKKMGKK